MTDASLTNAALPPPPPPPRRFRIGRRGLGFAAALLAAFAVGGIFAGLALHGHRATMVTLTPAPISAMRDWTEVAIKGQVAEIFGNKFVLQDDSGRALIETGPAGDDGGLVAKAEPVTVQGRFENGFIHAEAITHADGRSDMLGPPGPRPHLGPLAMGGPRGLLHWR